MDTSFIERWLQQQEDELLYSPDQYPETGEYAREHPRVASEGVSFALRAGEAQSVHLPGMRLLGARFWDATPLDIPMPSSMIVHVRRSAESAPLCAWSLARGGSVLWHAPPGQEILLPRQSLHVQVHGEAGWLRGYLYVSP